MRFEFVSLIAGLDFGLRIADCGLQVSGFGSGRWVALTIFAPGGASRFFDAIFGNFASLAARGTRENACGTWLSECKNARLLPFEAYMVLQKCVWELLAISC